MKSLHVFNVLGGHQRHPLYFEEQQVNHPLSERRGCVGPPGGAGLALKKIKFQLLSVTFYPSQPKSRE